MATTDNRLPTEGTQKDIESDLRTIKSSIDTLANSISPTATNVSFSNTGTGMTASNVQSAITELNDEKQDSITLGGINAPNFNDLTTSGCHWVACSNSTNSPFTDPTGKYGFLEIVKGANTIIMQRFTEYRSDSTQTDYGSIYIRFYANNRWYGWKQKV